MKLIIQIPCYNEENTIHQTLSSLPETLKGIDEICILIIDDGSTDQTVPMAKNFNKINIIQHSKNQGLARAFSTGLEAALHLGADIIVNTDADHQYCSEDIQKLIDPILSKKADLVVGARPIHSIQHFSKTKKILLKIGSWIVKHTSGADVLDAPCGFRAFSRACAQQLNVFSSYTYTLETVIQAGKAGMNVLSVPIRVHANVRPSRLIKNNFIYVLKSAATIIRIFLTYRPLIFFLSIGFVLIFFGLLIDLRFLYLYITSSHNGSIQSLILSAILLLSGFFLVIMGLLADLISVNRKIIEKIDFRLKCMEDRLKNNK